MTRGTRLEKLVLVDDCGVILNPMIVAGQVHGGAAQGLGEAFYEQMRYSDDGQPLTARCWITRCRAPAVCRRSSLARR